jgi:hypothetical protein
MPSFSYKDQTLSQIDQGLGIKSSFYGWYAQLPESGSWDGGQLLSIIDDVKASGAIFQPAVMPNSNNWNGLTPDNNYQALAIANVMEKFTSQGIEVWLRFAHEVNWYQTDGTYSGGVQDFKQAWAAVAAAVKGNPLVKMVSRPHGSHTISHIADMCHISSTLPTLPVAPTNTKRTSQMTSRL